MSRRFKLFAAAVATVTFLLPPGPVLAQDAEPVPIPGGIDIGGGEIIHIFLPGPVELGLQGENIEPNVITNFDGFVAMAYVNGTATDADGVAYTMLTDIRIMQGTYVAADGSVNFGTFALI
jgi:hypothetical protein